MLSTDDDRRFSHLLLSFRVAYRENALALLAGHLSQLALGRPQLSLVGKSAQRVENGLILKTELILNISDSFIQIVHCPVEFFLRKVTVEKSNKPICLGQRRAVQDHALSILEKP
jgi:hypothetical protein